jgi:hypothetical protein
MTTAQPAKFSSALFQRASVSVSRSLVGSSSSSTLPPDFSSLARCTRLRWPPESMPTFCCWSPPLKLKRAAIGAAVHLALAELDDVVAAGDFLPDGLVAIERVAALVDIGEICTVSPTRDRAAVGLFLPVIIRNSVVLPAPFGPMTPTMPPGGSLNVRSSISSGRHSP